MIEMNGINGLVLAGGKSSRMGDAKDRLTWHGKEQRYFAADLLGLFCDEVFISCRQDQVENFDKHYLALTDTFLNIGPLGGILSALRFQSDRAWLVVACDLPLLDESSLKYLIDNRRSEKIATAYESPFDGLPEPLLAIWEPKSYPVLLRSSVVENLSLRNVLINNDVFVLKAPYPEALMNVNTTEDATRVNQILQKRDGKLDVP